jgi:hypothetical protein
LTGTERRPPVHAIERHARTKQLLVDMDTALERKAHATEEYDALFLEYEALQTECYDEDCPCTDQDDDGN